LPHSPPRRPSASGTLSPLDLYPKLLNFAPIVRVSFPMSVHRPCICPLVVTRGSDQRPVSSRYQLRDDASVFRNYGDLLISLAEVVPDGMICFFTSYEYLEKVGSATLVIHRFGMRLR
jgi:DNA excision repair protein ERCC-2